MVDTSQNYSRPNSEIVFQIFDLVGGLSRREDFFRYNGQVRIFVCHFTAPYATCIVTNELSNENFGDDDLFPITYEVT